MVVPLCSGSHAITHLNPVFPVNGKKLYMSIMDMAGIPAMMFSDAVLSLEDRRTEIVDALDFLANGF